MALSEKMKLRMRYAKRLAALPRNPLVQLTNRQRVAVMRARAALEDESRSKWVTDLDSALELHVLEEIARLDPGFAEVLSVRCQHLGDSELMDVAKWHYDYLVGADGVEDSVPEEAPQVQEKGKPDVPPPELKGLTKAQRLPSSPSQPDTLEAPGPRKFPVFNPGSRVSEVYGMRGDKLLGIATRNLDPDTWTAYIAKHETSLHAGVAQRFEMLKINDVKNIFNKQGLELRFLPEGIKMPDLATLAAGASAYRGGAQMNEKQKIVLVIVAVTVLAMLIFPPFYAKFPGGEVFNVGYGLIVDPPPALGESRPETSEWAHVNIGLLITQWVGVLIAGAIAYILYRD
jgi:hypothetical protein